MRKKRDAPFTPNEDDEFLELYIAKGRGWRYISEHTRRDLGSVKKRTLRLCKGRLDCSRYVPVNRTNRKGLEFTAREIFVIRDLIHATDLEILVPTDKRLQHLSKVLMRPVKEIREQIEPNRGKGFFG